MSHWVSEVEKDEKIIQGVLQLLTRLQGELATAIKANTPKKKKRRSRR